MSTIKKISLTQFRNYDRASFDFDAPIVCITGLNGVGKTNLLDAIYYLCYTKSYFTGYQHQLAKHGSDGFRLEGVFEEDEKMETVACKWQRGKKEIQQDGVLCENVKDFIGKHTAVMIAPDDIEIINEGSEVRRKWLDSILAQTDKQYFESLLQYQQTLAQRNAWLKMNALKAQHDFTLIDFYDSILTATGIYIFEARRKFIVDFKSHFEEYYKKLSDGREEVEIVYKSDLLVNSFDVLLKNSLANDMMMQRTLKGIHKDELDFLMNGKPVRQFGSQGQKKSFLFALKVGQYKYLQMVLRKPPVLLLDDIFEKLDTQRLERLFLLTQVIGCAQIVLSSAELERLTSVFSAPPKIRFISL